jgi:hypothetical protein
MTAQTPITPAERSATTRQAASRSLSGQGTRLTRAAALTGVLFVVCLVSGVVLTVNAPNTNASTAKITHYVLTHKGRYGLSGMLNTIGVISGISFAVYLRTYFRRFVPEWMTSLFLVGVVVFAISGVLSAGVEFAYSDHPQLLSGDSIRLLNDISQNVSWAPLAAGLTLTYAAIALMIRSAGALPKALSGLAWVMTALAASFFLAFIPLILTAVFALIASIRMAQRNPDVSAVIKL